MKRTALILILLTTACFIYAGSKVIDTAGQVTNTVNDEGTPETGVTFTAKAGQPVPFGYMVASATTVCAKVKLTDWQVISPVDMKARWYFRIKHKDKPEEILNVTGLIQTKTAINNADYYYYFVPLENKGNIVHFTSDGAYIRNLKFPVFSILFLDVVLDPEIHYLHFPFVVGEQWTEKSTGTVTLMNFFKVTKSTTTKFNAYDEADITINGKTEHVFRVKSEIDKGEGKLDHEENWYAVNIGLVYQDTEAYTLELVKFVPGSEMNNLLEADAAPEDVTPQTKI